MLTVQHEKLLVLWCSFLCIHTLFLHKTIFITNKYEREAKGLSSSPRSIFWPRQRHQHHAVNFFVGFLSTSLHTRVCVCVCVLRLTKNLKQLIFINCININNRERTTIAATRTKTNHIGMFLYFGLCFVGQQWNEQKTHIYEYNIKKKKNNAKKVWKQ